MLGYLPVTNDWIEKGHVVLPIMEPIPAFLDYWTMNNVVQTAATTAVHISIQLYRWVPEEWHQGAKLEHRLVYRWEDTVDKLLRVAGFKMALDPYKGEHLADEGISY